MTTRDAELEVNLLNVVEAYRLDRYDNLKVMVLTSTEHCCRSLSFG